MSLVDADDLRRIDGEVQSELDEAVEAALKAPYPNPEDVLTDVYVSE
jgi:TPP-dependent pyruvate/acetoin dehydrogenase alpha subunit